MQPVAHLVISRQQVHRGSRRIHLHSTMSRFVAAAPLQASPPASPACSDDCRQLAPTPPPALPGCRAQPAALAGHGNLAARAAVWAPAGGPRGRRARRTRRLRRPARLPCCPDRRRAPRMPPACAMCTTSSRWRTAGARASKMAADRRGAGRAAPRTEPQIAHLGLWRWVLVHLNFFVRVLCRGADLLSSRSTAGGNVLKEGSHDSPRMSVSGQDWAGGCTDGGGDGFRAGACCRRPQGAQGERRPNVVAPPSISALQWPPPQGGSRPTQARRPASPARCRIAKALAGPGPHGAMLTRDPTMTRTQQAGECVRAAIVRTARTQLGSEHGKRGEHQRHQWARARATRSASLHKGMHRSKRRRAEHITGVATTAPAAPLLSCPQACWLSQRPPPLASGGTHPPSPATCDPANQAVPLHSAHSGTS